MLVEAVTLGEATRLAGLAAWRRPDEDAPGSRAALGRAIEVARIQGARLLELRATADYCRLPAVAADGDGARRMLEAVLQTLPDDSSLPDCADARALLQALAAP